MQQVRDWVKLYERHFNTWGRKVELVFVDGSGQPRTTRRRRPTPSR